MNEESTKKTRQEFEGQRDGEELLFIFRRHIITMRKGLYLLFLSIVLTSFPLFIWDFNYQLFYLSLGGILLGIILFFYHFILWYFSVYIVTNQRIRQIAQKGLFGREVIDLKLSKVQNVSYSIPGINGEVLHFGTIVIQTLVGDLIIRSVSNPDKIYNRLQDALGKIDDGLNNEEINK